MHIFIRHGNDDHVDYNYKQDPSLNSLSHYKEDILNHTYDLIKKYGYPDLIYCSPFHRARQTAKIMNKIFKNDIPIKVNNKLSRFFSKKEKLNPLVKLKTLHYNPPIQETQQEFKQRVDRIIKQYKKQTIWYITHYLVIKRIAKINNQSIPKQMPFLYTMVVN